LLAEFVAIVFVSERGSPFTTAGFARMIERTTIAVYREAAGAARESGARLTKQENSIGIWHRRHAGGSAKNLTVAEDQARRGVPRRIVRVVSRDLGHRPACRHS
jgi:hypothetical protein